MPDWLGRCRGVLAALGIALGLPGCAALRSYDAELYSTLERASSGAVDDAIKLLEANNRRAEKDLLYYLELGMLQRLAGRYEESQKAWKAAAAAKQASSAGGAGEVADFMRGLWRQAVGDKTEDMTGDD